MNHLRLLMKLAFLPYQRAWVLTSLMVFGCAQLWVALWFCGAVKNEIAHTRAYASSAQFITIQMKDEQSPLDSIKEILPDQNLFWEEVKTEDVLTRMEKEEPELVQTVRAIGKEGLQLVPRLITVRGVVSSEALEKLRLVTDIAKLEVSPVHHARLIHFYDHLAKEIGIVLLVILVLALIQFAVFQRIQRRDTNEVFHNLMIWGVGNTLARVPGFLSLVVLCGITVALSVVEWVYLKMTVWKAEPFLGELSLDRTLSFPWTLCAMVLGVSLILSFVLGFAGRSEPE